MDRGQILEVDDQGRHRPLLWAVEAQAAALSSPAHHGGSGFVVSAVRCPSCGLVEQYATQAERVVPRNLDP